MALLATGVSSRCGGYLLALILALAAGSEISAPAQVADYQVKAVFLFNFTEFVRWPSQKLADTKSPIAICVLGDDPFGGYLDATIRGETVGKRRLVVRRYRHVEDVDSCQILFISNSEIARLAPIFDYLKNRSILTVGDADGFARRGGMVCFVTQDDRIRLRVNLAAAKAAGLTLSSKLLRVAEIVPSPEVAQ